MQNEERLIVLGTGYAMATECYNTCFLIQNDQGALLVDAGGGNGILRQMALAGVGFETVCDFFITHAHPDHLCGAIWVLRKTLTMMRGGQHTGTLTIHCHPEIESGLRAMASLMLQEKLLRVMRERVTFHPIADGSPATLCGYDATCFDIHSTKIRQYGFTLRLQNGRRLTCLGDEPYNPACGAAVAGSDWLLCEAFCLAAHADRYKPYEKHHSTAADAARTAQQLGVKRLVLWHTEDQHLATRKALYTAEARPFFDGEIFVPDDLDVITL